MKEPFLEGTDVARSFGGLRVLTRVSFAVSEGEIVALIGPNGEVPLLLHAEPGAGADRGGAAAPGRPRGAAAEAAGVNDGA